MSRIGRVAVALAAVAGPALLAGAVHPGASRLPAFTVVDDAGKFVGQVVELGTRTDGPWWATPAGGVPTVLVRLGEHEVLFRLGEPSDLRIGKTVYYQGVGCTGTAKALPGNFDRMRGELYGIGIGSWLLRGTGQESSMDYQSWARDGSSCQESGFDTLSETPWKVEPVADLTGMFTPPFHIIP